MSVKQFEGKILKITGNRATTGEILQITPATGKTFYLSGCAIYLTGMANAANANLQVELRNDVTVIEELGGQARHWTSGSAASAGKAPEHTTGIVKGDSLVGNGVKKYVLQAIVIGSGSVVGTLYGYIENDADDPRL